MYLIPNLLLPTHLLRLLPTAKSMTNLPITQIFRPLSHKYSTFESNSAPDIHWWSQCRTQDLGNKHKWLWVLLGAFPLSTIHKISSHNVKLGYGTLAIQSDFLLSRFAIPHATNTCVYVVKRRKNLDRTLSQMPGPIDSLLTKIVLK